MSSRAAIYLMLASAQDLQGLASWPPCGALLNDVIDYAKHGIGGLSVRDLGRLRTWSRRWMLVDQRVREFYEHHAASPDVGAALWSILDARPRPDGWGYGRLVVLWDDTYGYKPQIELCPKII